MKKIFLILKMTLILSGCGQVKLKSCDMRIYKINGEICRYERREDKVVCRKASTKFIALKTKGLVCLKNNLDRVFDSLNHKEKK